MVQMKYDIRVALQVMAGTMGFKPTFIPFHFIRSPNTTSATTYNVKGFIEQYNGQYTMIVNGSGYRYNNDERDATSNLTLMGSSIMSNAETKLLMLRNLRNELLNESDWIVTKSLLSQMNGKQTQMV